MYSNNMLNILVSKKDLNVKRIDINKKRMTYTD